MRNITKLNLFNKTILLLGMIQSGLASLSYATTEQNDINFCSEIETRQKVNVNVSEIIRDTKKQGKDAVQGIKDKIKGVSEAVEQKDYDAILKKVESGFADISELISTVPGTSDEAIAKIQTIILDKLNASLNEVKERMEFKLRISLMPNPVCNKIIQTNNLENLTLINGSTKAESQYVTGGFMNPAYKQKPRMYGVSLDEGYRTKSNEKMIELVSFNLNIERYKDDNSDQFITETSGGVVVNLPKSFTSPVNKVIHAKVNIPLYGEYEFVPFNTKVRNLVLNQERKQNHFVGISFQNIKHNAQGLTFGLKGSENPKFDLYFTDKIYAVPQAGTRFVQIVPTFENKANGLLVEVMPQFCEQPNIREFGWVSWAFCKTLVETNVVFNHLVLELKGYKINKNSRVILPDILLPRTTKGESGGAGLMVRLYKSEDDRFYAMPMKTMYFGSDSIELLNTQLTKSLEEKNQELHSKVIGTIIFGQHLYSSVTTVMNVVEACHNAYPSPMELAAYQNCVDVNVVKIDDSYIYDPEQDSIPTTWYSK